MTEGVSGLTTLTRLWEPELYWGCGAPPGMRGLMALRREVLKKITKNNHYSRVGRCEGGTVCVRIDWGGRGGAIAVNTAHRDLK